MELDRSVFVGMSSYYEKKRRKWQFLAVFNLPSRVINYHFPIHYQDGPATAIVCRGFVIMFGALPLPPHRWLGRFSRFATYKIIINLLSRGKKFIYRFYDCSTELFTYNKFGGVVGCCVTWFYEFAMFVSHLMMLSRLNFKLFCFIHFKCFNFSYNSSNFLMFISNRWAIILFLCYITSNHPQLKAGSRRCTIWRLSQRWQHD